MIQCRLIAVCVSSRIFLADNLSGFRFFLSNLEAANIEDWSGKHELSESRMVLASRLEV